MMRERLLEWSLFGLAALSALFGYGFPDLDSGGFTPSARDGESLRVVTWNVGGSGGGGHPLRVDLIPPIVKSLRSLEADLVFLQEVGSRRRFRDLAAQLGVGESNYGLSRRGRGLAVLAPQGRLQWREVRLAGKSALIAFYIPESGKPLIAITLHADAFSSKNRNQAIGEAVDRLTSTGFPAAILAGDLNFDLDIDKRRDLFTDNEHLDVETYNYAASRFRDVGVGSGSTAEPDRRLDYIFTSPGAFEVLAAGPWKGQRVGDMDHDPLVADLKRVSRPGS